MLGCLRKCWWALGERGGEGGWGGGGLRRCDGTSVCRAVKCLQVGQGGAHFSLWPWRGFTLVFPLAFPRCTCVVCKLYILPAALNVVSRRLVLFVYVCISLSQWWTIMAMICRVRGCEIENIAVWESSVREGWIFMSFCWGHLLIQCLCQANHPLFCCFKIVLVVIVPSSLWNPVDLEDYLANQIFRVVQWFCFGMNV